MTFIGDGDIAGRNGVDVPPRPRDAGTHDASVILGPRRMMAESLRASAARASNLLWERRLGISTRGRVDIDFPDSVHYATMSYSTIWSVLTELQLRADDVLVDVGCGRGRVLCCAARLGLRKVMGVDVSEQMCAEARANAAQLRGRRTPITVEAMPAQFFDYSEATAVYLFDPFGAATLDLVLKKIQEDRDGRPVRFAYANPTQSEVFDRQDWLEPTRMGDLGGPTATEHAVRFYRSVGGQG